MASFALTAAFGTGAVVAIGGAMNATRPAKEMRVLTAMRVEGRQSPFEVLFGRGQGSSSGNPPSRVGDPESLQKRSEEAKDAQNIDLSKVASDASGDANLDSIGKSSGGGGGSGNSSGGGSSGSGGGNSGSKGKPRIGGQTDKPAPPGPF